MLHLDLAELADSVAHAASAAQLYINLGAPVDLARTHIIEAEISCVASGYDRAHLELAVDAAVPALLFIDRQRAQFPTASARQFWRSTFMRSLSAVFDWAYRLDDAELLTELIEVTINAGVHTHTATSSAHVSPIRDTYRTHKTTMRARRLAPRAVLPLRVAPRLLLPNQKVALATYFDAMESRYGAAGTTPTAPVRTW